LDGWLVTLSGTIEAHARGSRNLATPEKTNSAALAAAEMRMRGRSMRYGLGKFSSTPTPSGS
jgi:hypothetical protein